MKKVKKKAEKNTHLHASLNYVLLFNFRNSNCVDIANSTKRKPPIWTIDYLS